MTVYELKLNFLKYMLLYGHEQLKEIPLFNSSGDTFFTNAAVKSVIDFYNNEQLSATKNFVIIQRMFSANQIEYSGRFPLATSMEVQMSIFRFAETDPLSTFDIVLNFLESIGISKDNLYFLAPKGYGVEKSLSEVGFPKNNIVFWEKPMVYKLGEKGPTGHYGRFLLAYKHGIFPLVDLTFVNSKLNSKNLIIESCFYLDRIFFTLKGVDTWFETPLYKPIVDTIKEFTNNSTNLVYITATLIRALVALIGDGLEISAKGPGYIGRKIVRYLVQEWWIEEITIDFSALIEPSIKSLIFLGYDFDDYTNKINLMIRKEQLKAQENIKKADSFIKKQVERLRNNRIEISSDKLQEWRESRGISEEIALLLFKKHGYIYTLSNYNTKTNEYFNLKMNGYSYESHNIINDPVSWLISAEKKLYSSRQ